MINLKSNNRRKLRISNMVKRIFYPILLFLEFIHVRKFLSKITDNIVKAIGINKSQNIFFRYKVFAKIFKDNFSYSKNTNSYDLVFPTMLGVNSNLTLIILTLAKEALNKGYKPCLLICDSAVNICSKERINKTRENSFLFCHECYKGYDFLKNNTGLPVLKFSEFLRDNNITKKINQEKVIIAGLKSLEECISYTYDDYKIGEIAKKSVLRYFLIGDFEFTVDELRVYKEFLVAGVIEKIVIDSFFAKYKDIKKVIIPNGTLQFEKIFCLTSTNKNIDYITYETFLGNSSFIFKKNDEVMNLNWHLEAESFYSKTPWKQEYETFVHQHFKGIEKGKGMYALLNDKHDVNRFSNLNEYAVLFTNLNFDTAVIDKRTIFRSMKNWIEEVINYWEQNHIKIHLIIRVHPGEIKLKTASSEFLGDYIRSLIKYDKIILVDSDELVNSYELINNMKFGLVYASTIGLEIAYRDKPCVVGGKPFYLNAPFVISPTTKTEFFDEISSLIFNRIFTPDKVDLYKLIYYTYHKRNWNLIDIKTRTPGGDAVTDLKTFEELKLHNIDFLDAFFQELN